MYLIKWQDLFCEIWKQTVATATTILLFGPNTNTLVNTGKERPGGGEKTPRSSRLPPPTLVLPNTLNEHMACVHIL